VAQQLHLSIKNAKMTLTEMKMSLERQHGHNIDVWKNGEFYLWSLLVETILFVLVLYY